MQASGLDDMNKYKLNQYQFQEIRNLYPKINLYLQPVIGTEDVRQFLYCPRIIYFRYVICAPMKKTYKMEYGELKHEKIQKLKNKSDDDCIQKYYNIYLNDADLGLVGLIDYFEFDGKTAFPVEIKSGNIPLDGLNIPHKYQIIAQAILIEKNFDFMVNKMRINYIKHQKSVDYRLLIEDKLKCMKIIRKIRELLIYEKIPEPTKDQGKCVDCECKNYCYRG